MKILIPHDNGVWVRDIVVSELWVAALGLDGTERDKSVPGYQLVVRYRVVSIEWFYHYGMVSALQVAASRLKGPS